MYRLTIVLAFLLTLIFTNDLLAQENRFGAGAIVGLSFSQIRGDDTGGYNKLGLQAGLRGVVHISDKIDVSTELLFSQRGSRSEKNNPAFPFGQGVISLNYVEVPVFFNYKDWRDSEDEFYRINFYGGLSYGRLISASTNRESTHSGLEDQFNKNDYSISGGVTFYATEHLGFSARFVRSINLLFDNTKAGNESGFEPLKGFLINVQALYMF